eukprot:3794979-Alexandrium_andersonii.AAC.1
MQKGGRHTLRAHAPDQRPQRPRTSKSLPPAGWMQQLGVWQTPPQRKRPSGTAAGAREASIS